MVCNLLVGWRRRCMVRSVVDPEDVRQDVRRSR